MTSVAFHQVVAAAPYRPRATSNARNELLRVADTIGMRRRFTSFEWLIDERSRKPKPGAAKDKLALARAMRRAPTPGEAALWKELRERQVGDWKFRRQQVIAGYIVDFYCADLRLVVEVDGKIHDQQELQDACRDEQLNDWGVRVLRVREEDVCMRMLEVLRKIATACETIAEHACPPKEVRGRARKGARR